MLKRVAVFATLVFGYALAGVALSTGNVAATGSVIEAAAAE